MGKRTFARQVPLVGLCKFAWRQSADWASAMLESRSGPSFICAGPSPIFNIHCLIGFSSPESNSRQLVALAMMISMLDQMIFPLACRHTVVLGRLEGKQNWICEECGTRTGLNAEPFKAALAKDLDTAQQIDLQVKSRGATITREVPDPF